MATSKNFIVKNGLDVAGPITTTSNTLVTNLNADTLDGQHGSYYAPIASPSFTTPSLGVATATSLLTSGNVTVGGDLIVNGTTTTINATTITVDDINIELGSVASPTDDTANGGGITLKGASDKTITWDKVNANWTSSENWNIASSKSFKINNVVVLNSTTLGSTIVSSSLTGVGTITSGTWSGSFGAVSGANLTSLTAANLTGTIPSAVLGNSSHYVGTTAIALNRASGAQTLTGVSIDGNAATATNATNAANATTAVNVSGGSVSATSGTFSAAFAALTSKTTQTTVNASTASTTIDLASADHFLINISTNTSFVLSNISNRIGGSGNILIKQDATGGWSFTKATEMKTPLGGAAIVQVTTGNSLSLLSYYVVDASTVIVNYIGNFA